MSKLILVDGNSLFFKSFYATYHQLKDNVNGTRSKNGEPINAVRTFSHLIINLKKLNPNSHILVAFDEKGSDTFRHKYDFYKANRKKQPDDLYSQIPLVRKFLDLFGIKWIANKNYEADDIIGILANNFKNEYQIEIITTDKDLLQLVDKNVKVLLSKSGISNMDEYNYENFKSKFFNLTPSQIPDFKGIMGDNSDNLKGIPGLGPKTAIDLLCKYNNLENIFENIDCLSESHQLKIKNGKQSAILCKELATIIIESEDIKINIEEVKLFKLDKYKLTEFLQELNIFNLIKKI